MSRKIIQQALEALKDTHWSQKNVDAIAALEAELAKPEQYDQTTLELCDKCGWKTLIPDDCCLNCERNKFEQEPVAWHSHNPDYPIQDGDWVEVIFTSGQPDDAKKWTPLYTAPQKPDVTLISEGNINIS